MCKKISILFIATLIFFTGCTQKIPESALQLSPDSLANRQLQTRRFDTTNNQAMLAAAAATMQDLGFTLDESESTLGVLVGSKTRDATNSGQVAAAVFVALFSGAVTHVDKEQIIRISMVMRELGPTADHGTPQSSQPATQNEQSKAHEGQSTVRVTFQRIIYNTAGNVTRAEQINDAELYKEFFDKLSKSVFLEAHEI